MGVSPQQIVKQVGAIQEEQIQKTGFSQPLPGGKVYQIDRWLLRRLLQLTDYPAITVYLWDGNKYNNSAQSEASILFRDRNAMLLVMRDPEFYFGELYMAGRIEVAGDLLKFLQITLPAILSGNNKVYRVLASILGRRPRSNSLTHSRDNIYHHYDIGNDFYSRWLDKAYMQYTCAYFPDQDMDLEQAQKAKLHHVCRKLDLKPGETVVEAGCGWGGLARFMAKYYGVKVRAYNISHEQLVYARSMALQEGLADRVEYVESDYRHIEGQYDVFVSVGMLEHVGQDQLLKLGKVIDRCLKAGGRGLVHSIGRNQPRLMNAWTEKRIFPGAYPPSLVEMVSLFEPHDFSIQDVENLRLHYAQTLQHWLERYELQSESIREDFDEEFERAWRLYLAGSIAAFTTGKLQLFQIVFSRPQSNFLPRSRAHLYADDTDRESRYPSMFDG